MCFFPEDKVMNQTSMLTIKISFAWLDFLQDPHFTMIQTLPLPNYSLPPLTGTALNSPSPSAKVP